MKNRFLYGTVIKLTREDTPADIERNFIQMREAGFDTAVVWPAFFWWEEKGEDYPFRTGKEVLRLAEKHGLGIVMELAGQLPQMEYIPDCEMKREYFCTDEQGHPQCKHNSFGTLNYFHPEVNAKICERFAAAARAYQDFSALVAYDIFNETAFNSYDEYTLAEFRLWLQEKYGTVARLNEVWERCYTDFSQVSFTPWMWMSVMPAADFTAFRKAAVGIILKRWGAAIRTVDSTHPLWADNIGSMICNGAGVLERPQEDFDLKNAVDEIGMSFYPKQVNGTKAPHWRWCTFDAFYAASGREGFYVAEMQTHVQALFNPTTCVRPYELKQWCCEALAGGAKGLIYWMWRPFTKGLQTAGRGLVDYRNRSTPRLAFAEEFGKMIRDLGALTPVRSRVGILFDGRCQDLQTYYTKCYRSVDQNIYMNSLCGAYKAFFDAGVRADIVRLEEIGQYRMIVLSNQIVMDGETAAALQAYAEAGGVILCDGKFGVVDENALLCSVLPGGPFHSLVGQEFEDTDYEQLDFRCEICSARGYYGRDLMTLTDGEVLGTFADGYPAVVRRRVGKGEVISINTYLWYGYHKEENDAKCFAAALAERYGLREVKLSSLYEYIGECAGSLRGSNYDPSALRVRLATDGEIRYAFVFNYGSQRAECRLSGGGFDREICVPARDVLILKEEK